MTKTTTRCGGCSNTLGPFFLGMCPACIDDWCGNGDGESIGLASVPEEAYDDVIVQINQHEREHTSHHQDCMLCHLVTDVCDECGLETREMMGEDDEAHLIVQDIVLVGCEGYHEPAFRYAYWGELNG